MSSKYRRQSIYLQRKTMARANSKSNDQYDDWNYDSDHDHGNGTPLPCGTYPWFYGGATAAYCSGTGTPGTTMVQFGSLSTMTNATLQAIQSQIPPPSLETMKVIKGFEFVTFTPVDIDPPPLFNHKFSIQPFAGSSNAGTSTRQATELLPLRLSPILSSQSDSARSRSTSSPISNHHQSPPQSSLSSVAGQSSLLNISSASGNTDPETTMVKSFNLDRMPANILVNEITESEARDALFSYVGDKFCYGTKAALRMTIHDMFHSYVFQYSLESFCEKRQLCWSYEPYAAGCCAVLPETPVGKIVTEPNQTDSDLINDQSIVSLSSNSTIPKNAWNIEIDELKALHKNYSNFKEPSATTSVKTIATETNDIVESNSSPYSSTQSPHYGGMGAKLFQDKQINAIVPGTISIQSCHNCGGIGRKRCTICAASGSKSCQTCHGNGFYYGYYHKSIAKTFESSPTADYNNCWRCHGRGRIRCYTCNGDGMIMCAACFGSGQIRCYIKVIVTLTNHKDSVLIRDQYSADIPLDLLSLVDGDIIFEEEGHNSNSTDDRLTNKLCHITNFIDDSITRESLRLTQMHEANYLRNSRLILQRHRIKVIPIAKVIAFWQRKQFHFYVFGSERKCYTGNYPQRYSCSCCCVV